MIRTLPGAAGSLAFLCTFPFLCISLWGQSWTCGSGSCTTTGKVGVGTSSPSAALNVVDTTTSEVRIQPSGTNKTLAAGYTTTSDQGYIVSIDPGNTLKPLRLAGYNQTLDVGVNGDVHAMTITNAGNVGVGTTSPSQLLSVGSSSQFTVSSSGAVVASGGVSSPQGTNSERVGAGATASATNSVAIGYNAHADYDTSITIGRNAAAAGARTVQIGYSATAAGDGTAVGWGADAATGGAGTAVGFDASASGNAAISLGMSSAATAHGSVTLGFGAATSGEYSFGAGYGANAQGGGSQAIGAFSATQSTHSSSIVMGYEAASTAANQFVVGGIHGPINDVYIGRGVTGNATNPPMAVTINSNGGYNTDQAGGSLTLAGGKARGSGSGGDVIIATSDPGSSGTTLQSLSTKVIVKNTGIVGIGTTTPCAGSVSTCKLAVKGAIRANEVVVDTGWSDYVFAPDYRLAPLTEVGKFIADNHHLPNIPPAAEVAEKGISLGDMQAKLLAKIEELTLHVIRLDEKNKQLEQQNLKINSDLQRMQKDFAK